MLTSCLPRELREDLPPPLWFQCWLPQPAVVTTVHLRRASGLGSPKQPGEGGAEPGRGVIPSLASWYPRMLTVRLLLVKF